MDKANKSNIDDIIEGGTPDELESDTRASVGGDEIPESVVADESTSDIASKELAKTEEPGKPAAEESAEEIELSEAEKLFAQDEGLVNRYGSVEEMIRRYRDTNKYITGLEAERNRYREAATPPKEEPKIEVPSYEDFNEDPVGTIGKIVKSQTDGLRQQMEEMRVKAFMDSKSDFKTLEPLMEEQLNANPSLTALGYDAVPVLYQLAKAVQLSRATTESRKPETPPPDKAHAETSTGKKGERISRDDASYWYGKSLKEMEDELGFAKE